MDYDQSTYPSTPSFGSIPVAIPSTQLLTDLPLNHETTVTAPSRKLAFKLPLQKQARAFSSPWEPDAMGVSPHFSTNAELEAHSNLRAINSAPSKVQFTISRKKQVGLFENPLEAKAAREDPPLPIPFTSKILPGATRKAHEIQGALGPPKHLTSAAEMVVSKALASPNSRSEVPREPAIPAKLRLHSNERKSAGIEALEKAISRALAKKKFSPPGNRAEVSSLRKLSYKVVIPEWLLSYSLRGPPGSLKQDINNKNRPASSLELTDTFLPEQADVDAGTPTSRLSLSDIAVQANQKTELVSPPERSTRPKYGFKFSKTKQSVPQQTVRNPLEPVVNREGKLIFTQASVGESIFLGAGKCCLDQEVKAHPPSLTVEETNSGNIDKRPISFKFFRPQQTRQKATRNPLESAINYKSNQAIQDEPREKPTSANSGKANGSHFATAVSHIPPLHRTE